MRLGCIEYDILSLCFLKIKENHDFAQTPWYFCNFSRSICLNSYYKPPRLSGVEAHIAFMRSFRTVYRYPAIEIMLLAAVIFQVFSGIIFLIRGWKQRKGFISWLQAGSGAYLAFFLINHVGAVLYGRFILNLDTNFYYAAAGFYVQPFQFYFIPYYFLAVLALFTHLGCALYWIFQNNTNFARNLLLRFSVVLGGILSMLIVLMLAGVFYKVNIPQEYKATFEQVP